MSDSSRLMALAAAALALAVLACQASGQVPTVMPISSTAGPVTEVVFPTVTPIGRGTASPTPGGTPTATLTATATATPLATVKPGKLQMGPEDISYSLSAKRPEDDKVQMTITLHPRGGVPPFSFSIDSGPTISGDTYTFDWHNCGQSEPHTATVFSSDGQKTKPVGFIPPYDCK